MDGDCRPGSGRRMDARSTGGAGDAVGWVGDTDRVRRHSTVRRGAGGTFRVSRRRAGHASRQGNRSAVSSPGDRWTGYQWTGDR
jgi:hypothetical protein